MNREIAQKVFNRVCKYGMLIINDKTFRQPYNDEEVIEYISKGVDTLVTKKYDDVPIIIADMIYMDPGSIIQQYPNGPLDIDRMIDDSYREQTLKVLTDIRRELIRLNDKRDLESFVSGLSKS